MEQMAPLQDRSDPPLLAAQGVRVQVGGSTIVDDVDLRVGRGEVVGLLGPNGSGKSTLLRALAGLIAPDSGAVRLAGQDIATLDRRRAAAMIGYLPQNARSDWPISVRETVTLGRTPYLSPLARPTEEDRAAVDAAMVATDVSHLSARTVTTLSGGERMRVMLARVLAGAPTLLLLDEPVTGLDAQHQLEAMLLLRKLAVRDCGVLVVLHDLTLAARFCDRLAVLRAGRTVADGLPDDALTPEAIESAFDVSARVFRSNGDTVTVPWLPAPPVGGTHAEPR